LESPRQEEKLAGNYKQQGYTPIVSSKKLRTVETKLNNVMYLLQYELNTSTTIRPAVMLNNKTTTKKVLYQTNSKVSIRQELCVDGVIKRS
jgi:hypothetical protein